MIFNMTTGGGNTSLNFKVVGGTTQPTDTKENTIWVNTDVEIPNWFFTAGEPDSIDSENLYTTEGETEVANAGSNPTASSGVFQTAIITLPKGTFKITVGGTNTSFPGGYHYIHTFYDAEGNSVGTVMGAAGGKGTFDVPSGATGVRLTVYQYHKKLIATYWDNDEGAVWFQTGSDSKVEFNALKKNVLNVKPIVCRQFVGGAWVQKDAMTYMNDDWISWFDGYLWNYGDCEDITGGWANESIGAALASDGSIKGGTLDITTQDDNSIKITLSSTSSGGSVWYTKKAIDLTPFNILRVDGDMIGTSSECNDNCGLYIWGLQPNRAYPFNTTAYMIANKNNLTTSYAHQFQNFEVSSKKEINIKDLCGKFYIGFGLNSSASITLKSLKLEA